MNLHAAARRPLLPALGAGLLLLSLTACLGAGDPKRDAASGDITEAADADVLALRVGDCLVMSDVAEGLVDSVPTVPCSDPHDGEVYAEKVLAGDALPADADDQADEFCVTEFESFVGLPYADSVLSMAVLRPTEDSWDAGDRTVQCIVHAVEDVTGSLAGAGV